MPKLDEAKERLGFLKLWLGLFITAFFALIGWIAINYRNFDDKIVLYGACLCAVILLVLIIVATKYAKTILKEIRNLKK